MTKQDWLFLALGTLAIASLLTSIGTWMVLWDRLRSRRYES
ncbi:MAG TPA: hypothetical protein VF097_12360 [Actinomycetota bacterium]